MSTKAWTFLAMAYGWALAVGGALALLGIPLGSGAGLAVIALLYMPAPAVAALAVERRLVRSRLRVPRREGGRAVVRFFALPVLVVLAATGVLAAVTALLGNELRIPGVGVLAVDPESLRESLTALLGTEGAGGVRLPASPVATVIVAVVGGVLAGWTVNGLFALGEEYGWRGLLWEEVRPRGILAANLIIGAAWGLWHAPLILLGYNYPGHHLAGVAMMVVFTTAFSFVLTAVRELTGSVLPAAAAHGAFNGVAVFVTLAIPGANPLVGGPLGLLGCGALALVAVVLWFRVARASELDAGAVTGVTAPTYARRSSTTRRTPRRR
jgi:membrane protease YdiL (CAAX protease family)